METQAWDDYFTSVEQFLTECQRQYGVCNSQYTSYALEQLEFLESTCRTLITVLSQDFAGNAVTRLLSDLLANILILRSHWQSYSDSVLRHNNVYVRVPALIHNGVRGRPRFDVRKEEIEYLRSLSFSWNEIAALINISRSTLYRLPNEAGLQITCMISDTCFSMEVLLEYSGTKIPLNLPDCSSLLACIEEEIKKYDSSASVDCSEIVSSKYVLQRWSRKWEAYVVVKSVSEVMDGDLITVTLRPNVVQESTKKAIDICQSLKKKPSDEHRQILNKLYPSCATSSKKFDPLHKSVAELSHPKKKAAVPSGGKFKSLKAILVRNPLLSVPRGKVRKKLDNEGRIRTIQVRRNMTSADVRDVISNCFVDVSETISNFRYLRALNNNYLEILDNQEINGEAVVSLCGSGSLYLTDVSESPLQILDDSSSVQTSSFDDSHYTDPFADETDKIHDEPGVEITRVDPPSIIVADDEDSSNVDIVEDLSISQERQDLIHSQNTSYGLSLEADRSKDMALARISHEMEVDQFLRTTLCEKFDSMTKGDFEVAFKLGDGTRLTHFFSCNDTLQDLYGYVFSKGHVDPPFSLFATHPRVEIEINATKLQESTICRGSTLFIEYQTGTFKPSQFYGQSTEVTFQGINYDANFSSLLRTADQERHKYMMSLKLTYGIHYVSRSSIYGDVLEMYLNLSKSKIMEHYPVRARFNGEAAIDSGGVIRDVYSAFFEEMYLHWFEGSSLVAPSIRPGISLSSLKVIGTIISHCYLVCSVLPIRIAFPCLAGVLCDKYHETSIPDNILIDILLDSFSHYDSQVFKEAMNQIESGIFSEKIKNHLINVLSFYGCREIPSPSNLKKILLEVANFEFHTKPAAAIQSLRSGVPEEHKQFWKTVSVSHLYSIYCSMCASTEKILETIDANCEPSLPSEEQVLMYLKQYVGSLSKNKLSLFLRYVTGSTVCSQKGIKITFNKLEGLARRPIAHTCSCILELSRCYATYTDFEIEMDKVLQEKSSFAMDAL